VTINAKVHLLLKSIC